MRRISLFLAAGLALAACAPAPAPPTAGPAPGVVARLAADPAFGALSTGLARSGVAAEIGEAGPVTVLAPTDAAVAALPRLVRDTLFARGNEAALAGVLRGHVLPGRVPASALLSGPRLRETLAGTRLAVAGGAPITVGGAVVLAIDLPARDGVIHVIDRVLLPEGLGTGTGRLSTR